MSLRLRRTALTEFEFGLPILLALLVGCIEHATAWTRCQLVSRVGPTGRRMALSTISTMRNE